MSDIHALSGAYAVDALDEFERHAFERHLAHCDYCRGEVDSLREASVFFSGLSPVEPPAGLRDRVLADVAAVRPLPPLVAGVAAAAPTSLVGRRRRGEHSRRRVAGLVAAAAAVAAIGLGAAVTQPWQDTSTPVADAPPSTGNKFADAIMAAPDAEQVEGAVKGGTAVLVRSRQLNRAVLVTSGLDTLPAGKVYEAWFQAADGGLVPAGLMQSTSDGTVVLEGDAATATAVGITVEPSTGSTMPTTKADVLEFEQA